jgi:hypothetical protein
VTPGPTTTAVDLDLWLAEPAVRTYHRRTAVSDCHALWAAAGSVKIGESGLLGGLIRWRIPGARREQTYAEMFTAPPFVLLAQGEQHLIAGLCGKIWAARPVLTALDGPAEFLAWHVPGTVRVVFAQWVAPVDAGAELVSEVRVAPVDRGAQWRLRGLWPLIGRFQGLIGSEPLGLAVRRAERAQPTTAD